MNKSDSISNLAKALAAFQGEVKNPKCTANNPFFNSSYAPLSEIIDAAKPILAKHGLSYTQSVSGDGQSLNVTTLLMHASGEWIEHDSLTTKPERNNSQGQGSAATYARRYTLAAALGLAADNDDDGNESSQPSNPQTKKAPAPKKEPEFNITAYLKQLNEKYGNGLQEWADDNGIKMVGNKRDWSALTPELIEKLRSDFK